MLNCERCQSGCVPEVEHRCAKPGATSTADAASASSATAGIAREISGISQDTLKLFRAETDLLCVRARNLACLIALSAIVSVCLATTAAAASVLLLIGAALGVATLFGNAAWVGFVLVGTVTISVLTISGVLLWQFLTRRWYRQSLAKYPRVTNEVPPKIESELLCREVLKRRTRTKLRISNMKLRALNQLSATVREHPVAVGAMASALGVLIAHSVTKAQTVASDEPKGEAPKEQSHVIGEMVTAVLSILLK